MSLKGNLSYLFLEPEALAPTLDLMVDVSNINMLISDYILLSFIELLVATLETYNNHDDGAIGDNEIESCSIGVEKGLMDEKPDQQLVKEELDNPKLINKDSSDFDGTSYFEDGIEYEIVVPDKPQNTIDKDKIDKWNAQVNLSMVVKLAGVNLAIAEQDEETKNKVELIFTCIQGLKVYVVMKNEGLTVVSKIKRFYVEDLICSSDNNQGEGYKKMPRILSMLVSNPLLEHEILGKTEMSESTSDSRWLDDNYDINDTLQQLVVRIRNTKTELNLEFMFSNFRVLVNEKTIVRLFEFVFRIGHLLNRRDNQLDKIKTQIINYQKSIDPGMSSNNKVIDDIKNINENSKQGIFNAFIKIRQDYLIKEKNIKKVRLEKLEERHRINITGTVNNLQIWIPLEWNENESKLMTCSLSSDISHYSLTCRNYYINSLTDSIFKVEHISNVDDSKVVAKGLKVMIESITGADEMSIGSTIVKSIEDAFIRSTLLKIPRIELNYDKEAKIKFNVTDAAIVLQLMPIVVNVGFVEINEFISVYNRLFDVYKSIMDKNKNIIDKISQDYEEVKVTVSELVTNYLSSMVDSSITGNNAKTLMRKSRLAKSKIVNLTRVVVFVEKIQMSLIDDLGLYHQALLTLDIDNLKSTIQMENGKESAATFILRRLGLYEDPYLKADLVLSLQAYNFNFDSGVSEPCIEPWS